MKYILSSLSRFLRAGALLLTTALCLALPAQAQNTFVRLQTTQGVMDFKLLNSEAPVTVANFLAYVRGGDYTDVFYHRSVPNFVVQAGGYQWRPDGLYAVPSRGAIVNEFSVTRSNVRGTVAMAKLASGPNTATSQWFVNLANNASNLDNQNGGFTVFARATTPAMAIADRIATLPIAVADPPFDSLPVTVAPVNGQILRETVVRILAATELPSTTSNNDRIFNYLEAAYTQFVMPMPTATGEAYYFNYRYYAPSNSYLAEKDGRIWYYAPAFLNAPYDIGGVADWLAIAQAAGY